MSFDARHACSVLDPVSVLPEAPSTAQIVTVFLADSQVLFRQALGRLLMTQPGIRVVGESGDGEDVIRRVQRLRPAVLLLAYDLPGLDGLETLTQLIKLEQPPHVIMIASRANDGDTMEALQRGARGVVAKDSPSELLFKSVRMVAAGQYWTGRDSIAGLIRRIRNRGEDQPPDAFGLTRRELELIEAVAAGCANNDIAEQLKISPKTVKHHLTRIFAKLRVSNRLELALFAMQHRLRAPRNF
jgi:DNA-binding NarL/FixJ family response regulator